MKHQSIYRLPRVAELTATLAIALTLFSSAPALAVVSASGGTSVAATAANTCAIGKVSSIIVGTGVSDSATTWSTAGASQSYQTDAGVRAVTWNGLFNPTTAVIAADKLFTSVQDDVETPSVKGVSMYFPAYCNYANTKIRLKSAKGGMRLTALPANVVGNFRNAINYRAGATWGRSANSASALPGDNLPGSYVSTGTNGPDIPSFNGKNFGSDLAGGVWTAGGDATAARNATVNLRIRPRAGMSLPAATYFTGALGTALTDNTLPFLAGTYSDTLSVRVGTSF